MRAGEEEGGLEVRGAVGGGRSGRGGVVDAGGGGRVRVVEGGKGGVEGGVVGCEVGGERRAVEGWEVVIIVRSVHGVCQYIKFGTA